MNMNINILDPVVNFGKVTVSGGYPAGIDNIAVTLIVGDGSKLPNPADPAGSFNLVWFDSSTYSDPADDPKVEIVRCIANVSDMLTLMRAQEGTSASTKNTSGKIYKMILAPTKKTIDDIGVESQSKVNTHSALSTGVHGVGADTIDGVGARNIAISTHSSVISSVHGFNASGDAPAQTHGISKHTGTIGDHQGNLTGIGTNTHTQIDTAIGTTLPGLVTTHAALTTGVHGVTSNIVGISDTQILTNKTITGATNNVMAKSLKSATTVIDVSTASAPTAGQILTAIGSTAATWQTLTLPSTALSRQYFPAPSVNMWTNESYIDDDNNATVAYHSSSGASSGNYITYDLGAAKNFMMGGLYQLYNSNTVLTVGMRVQVSDDNSTWYTVSDVSHAAVATLTYNLNVISRARYIRFEAYYVQSTGARSVSILDMNLIF